MKKQIFILLVFSLVLSCKPKENMVYLSNHNFEKEVTEARYTGLKIKEGDILEIVVSAFDENAVKPFNLSTVTTTNTSTSDGSVQTAQASRYTVSSDGFVSVPVLGRVYCQGMTKLQLKEDLEQRLKVYLTDPMVDVRLTNLNISVLGEVKNPGTKTSVNERINLFQALAMAGDMTDAANRTNVKLLRYSENTKKDSVINLDFSEASIVDSPYYYLQQNDILYVEPDKNKQIAANTTNPNRALFLQVLTVVIALSAVLIRFAN
ncbi:polysaccharide biosynthesis/export family protein [Epilithonimonas mollis]|uniref:Polysaccharide export outer membrane protein n=1 Tax=Epilithonimonas mollis TaxID=216903 RepID=A0A1M6RR29_9FLAO|nr:polysaccharide biosynthesis/export family protein [Epilithonimonas mollis]SHK34767.1 polysaccharide export outer membrane protein [Epilithonimonas mollis]